MWIIITVVTLYLAGLGYWLYIRFFKNRKSVVRLQNPNQFSVEHNGHRIVIDYDHLKNKVLVEFNENGMTFKVIDGLINEPFMPEVKEEEVVMHAPERNYPEAEPTSSPVETETKEDDQDDDELDLHKLKQMSGNITKF
jgi:hypothetical protein